MTIPALPTAPSRDRPALFASESDAFLTALDPWAVAVDAVAQEVAANAVLAATSASAISLPDYTDISNSSLELGLGTKVFATSAGKLWGPGMPVVARTSTYYMRGTVVSYAGGTLTLNIEAFFGAGTHTSWTLALFLAPVGARGGGGDAVFWENDTTVNSSYTITEGKNAMSAGPVTIADGAAVIIPDGSTWSIV